MPSNVVCLKLRLGSAMPRKTSPVSHQEETDGSGKEMEEVFCILLSEDRRTGIRACKCSCEQDYCLQPKTLYICPIIGHEELAHDSLRWFHMDISPSALETKGMMRVKDSVTKKSFVLFLDVSACMVELKEESNDKQVLEPNDYNTVWMYTQGINSSAVAFYFRIGSDENTCCYFFTHEGSGKKIALQKSTPERILEYAIWSIEK